MKSKQLLSLVVVAAVLAGLAWWSSHSQRPAAGSARIGDRVLAGFTDRINDVASIGIRTPGTTAVVARVDGTWRVPGKYGYRADFSKVSDALRALADLKIAQVMHVAPKQLGDLHLQGSAAATDPASRATLIELTSAGGGTVAALRVGKDHNRAGAAGAPAEMGGFPDGKYVALDDSRVYLVGDRLDAIAPAERDWLDPEFLNVPATDIATLDVTGGTHGDIHLSRPAAGGELTLASIPAGKEADAAKISRLTGALAYLRFDDVADPALPPKATGLDQPVVYKATTTQGTVYTLRLGGSPSNDVRRYASVSVAFQAPTAAPVSATDTNAVAQAKARDEANRKAEDAARELNDKLSPWVYLLGDYQSGSVLTPASELIKDKASTNTPPADASAPAVSPAP